MRTQNLRGLFRLSNWASTFLNNYMTVNEVVCKAMNSDTDVNNLASIEFKINERAVTCVLQLQIEALMLEVANLTARVGVENTPEFRTHIQAMRLLEEPEEEEEEVPETGKEEASSSDQQIMERLADQQLIARMMNTLDSVKSYLGIVGKDKGGMYEEVCHTLQEAQRQKAGVIAQERLLSAEERAANTRGPG